MMMVAVPSLERQQVLAGLGSSVRGLSADEAAARRAEVGANQLPAARRRPVLAEFGAQFANMFAVVLIVAAGITFLAYALSTPRDSADLVLAIGILGVVLLTAVIGFAQEHAAERTAEALQALVPATARVIRDGELTEIPAVDLVPGDLVVLDAGDAISADCRLIDAHDLLVEMAALTGESRPTPRISDAVPQTQAADARNCVFVGTSVVNGSGRAVVFATGLATEFGRIYRLTAEMPSEDSPLQHEVTVMARTPRSPSRRRRWRTVTSCPLSSPRPRLAGCGAFSGEVVMMRIIVIGGTGLAEQVADALHGAGDEVTVIDTEPGRESALAKVGLRAVHGDALVPSTLEAAGALRADVLVACTQSDEDNLVISLLAKKRFNVTRVIARVNDPANDELFNHSWGVDALVSPATALVSMIRQES